MKRFLNTIIILLAVSSCFGVRIEQGDTARKVAFVAVDINDYVTRETSLTGVAAYYSIDGGAYSAMTTPTVAEVNSTYMPGEFWLSVDEAAMVTLAAGVDESELLIHITANEMSPVAVSVEVYRDIWGQGGLLYDTLANVEMSVENEHIRTDGTTGYANTGATFETTVQNSFAIVGWCKASDGRKAASQYLCAQYSGDDGYEHYFGITSAGKLSFSISKSGDFASVIEDTASFADGQNEWKHVCVIVTNIGGTQCDANLYVDGTLVKAGTPSVLAMAGVTFADDRYLFLGGQNNEGSLAGAFEGGLDNWRIYNAANIIDGDDVAVLYAAGRGLSYADSVSLLGKTPVAAWGMNDGTGTTLSDGTGSHAATLIGGAVWQGWSGITNKKSYYRSRYEF